MSIGRWYYMRDKRKNGPVTMAELRQLARTGQLEVRDMVLLEGASHWVEAQSLVGLFAPAAQAQASGPWQWLRRHRMWAGAGGALACVALVFLVLARTPNDSNAVPNDASADPSRVKDPTPATPLTLAKSIPITADLAQSFIQQLNKVRRQAGLGSVALDAGLNQGCQAHARYLLLNPGLNGAALFDEDSARTGFSSDGKESAPSALVFFSDPDRALRDALGRGDYRILLLDRQLLTIGLGMIHTNHDTWFTVLDVRRGPSGPVVLFPGDGQQDVAGNCSEAVVEGPTGKQSAGFPISVTFPPGRSITGVQARLSQSGTAIPTYLFTPDKPPPRYGNPARLIGLVPRNRLAGSTSYRVDVNAHIDGKPWSRSWTFATADDLDASGSLARQALAKVNHVRAQAGLATLVLDEQLSSACRKHVNYLVQNYGEPAVQGLSAHDEDGALPGSSDEGRRAGKASVITMGEHDPLDCVDTWLATLYHRVPLLDPRLTRMGFSCGRGPKLGWVNVLDAVTGRGKGVFLKPVVYPVDGQRAVPLQFPASGEVPDPIPDDKDGKAGYPITVTFINGNAIRNARATLKDRQGRTVPVWFSSPEKPANPRFARDQGGTICLIAQDPLQANTVYSVHVAAQVDGRPWEYAWSFTTGPAGITSAQAAAEVVDRINQFRAQAGVPRLALQEASSSRCEAHARYLNLNAPLLGDKQFKANDEDPTLPGFTPEGKQVSARTHIFFKAPAPIMQPDTLIAGLTGRPALLDPALRRIGFGCGLEPGRGWTCVLDLYADNTGTPIVYPAPDQTQVPLSGGDHVPEAAGASAGYPITVTFPTRAREVTDIQAVLTDHAGRKSDVLISMIGQGTIHILPRHALAPSTTYQIAFSARVAAWSENWRQSWRFTTSEK